MNLYLKFILLAALSVVAAVHSSYAKIISYSLIELFLLFYLSNAVSLRHKKTGYFLNLLFSLIILLQQAVLFVTGGFISKIMVDNINMMDNLGELLYTVIIGGVIIIAISAIPFKPIKNGRLSKYFGIVLSIIFIYTSASAYIRKDECRSPFLSFLRIIVVYPIEVRIKEYKHSLIDKEAILKQFHKSSIQPSHAAIEMGCVDKPNVIVLFVEGFSAEILDVNNDLDRNLTPNLNRIYNQSLVFTNYFNHTAATFRGLRGQLYSSCQYRGGSDRTMMGGLQGLSLAELNKKTSTKLISLVDILKNNGYHTSFVNPEHIDTTTTNYFKSFRFDELLMDRKKERALSDKEAFALLEETVMSAKSPFFIGMYNIGTHNGFDSPDVKYGDGSNVILNRFHNFDAQFGVFIDKLSQTNILDNTILIVTTDHASYPTPEHIATFKSDENVSGLNNTFINKIPLLIYWTGIKHQAIDAQGRNSLCLAPTLLDLLKIHDHENYFLGTSLFLKNDNIFETVSSLGDDFYYTGRNMVERILDDHKEVVSQMKQYYHISLNGY